MSAFLRAFAFMAGALVVTTLVHVYVHRRLARDTELAEPWRRRARVVTIFAASLLPAGMLGLLWMHDLPRPVAAALMGCAFTWVGLLLFLLPFLFVGDIVRAVRLRGAPVDPARRRAMARAIGLVGGVATLALGGASAVIAQLPLHVRRIRVPLAGLDPALRGYKIVQVSDVHVSATIGRTLVAALVAEIDALSPDLVALTGDLVDGSVEALGALVDPLVRVRARDGVYFVTGNHEYLSGVDEWLAFLRARGVRVLRNEHVAIGGAKGFDLVGIDDPSGNSWKPDHGSDLEGAVRGRDAARHAILLAHRPDHVIEASRHDVALQISGHTHGGQIAPIGWSLERLRQPYVLGLYEVGKTLLYVTSGAGYWGPPMRLGTRAEIAVFELTDEVG